MASSGYLISPHRDPSKKELWTETWKRIDRFLPELRGELALDEPPSEDKAPDETMNLPVQSKETDGRIEGTTIEGTKPKVGEEAPTKENIVNE
jgi:brefeldin A-resistance guanine nucleotide exchange factor 1